MRRFFRPASTFLTVGIIGFCILLTGQSNDPLFLRYSLRYLAVLAAYSVGVLGGVYVLSHRVPRVPGGVWLATGIIGVIVAAWLPIFNYAFYLNLTLKLVLLAFIMALLWHTGARLRHWTMAALIYLAVLISLSAFTLVEYPEMHISDEGWTADVGLTYVREGVLYSRIHQGIFGVPRQIVPFGNILPGYWFTIVGVGLFQARVIPFLGGLLLLALTYATARRLGYSRDAALLAVCVLAGGYAVWVTSHFFRLDIYLAAAGMAAMYLYLGSERRSSWAFLSGLLLSASIEFHQNALVLCTAAGAMLIIGAAARWRAQRRFSIQRRELLFVLGGFGGAAVFLILHVLPNPAEFLRQYHNGTSWRLDLNANEIGRPFFVLGQIVQTYWTYGAVELIVFAPILFGALFNRAARPLFLLLSLILLALNFLLPSFLVYYSILFAPLVAILVGGELVRRTGKNHILSLVICTAAAVTIIVPAIQSRYQDVNNHMLAAFKTISSMVQPDARMAVPQIFVFAMPDNPNLIALFMPRYAQQTHQTFANDNVWEHYRPDAFVVYGRYGAEEDPSAVAYRTEHHLIEVTRIAGLHQPLILYATESALRPSRMARKTNPR